MPMPKWRPPVREAAFLKQLSDDSEDLETLLVYADWLDDHGSADRAEFLRLQQQLLSLRQRQKGFAPASRRLRLLGQSLDPTWLAVVSRPLLTGTCWSGSEDDGTYLIWRFLPDGVLNYTEDGDDYQNGTWVQVGPFVAMEMNRHFADYEGFIKGDWVRGKAKNIRGREWRWKAKRTTDPEECDPGDEPDTTIYGNHFKD
jgi:uncharacterized protein (TIGR02996 family)